MDIVLNTVFDNPSLPAIPVPGFSDDFNRPAADTLGVTSGEGREWQLIDIGSNPSTWAITAGGAATLATPGSSYQAAVVEGFAADGKLTAKVKTIGSGRWGGLAFRAKDNKNFLSISEAGRTSQQIALSSLVNGSSTTIGSADSSVIPAVGDTISVSFVGTTVEVFLNGTSVLVRTVPDLANQTRHGLTAKSGTESSWDSITFTA